MSVNNFVKLGDYIEQIENRNFDLLYGISDVRGCSNKKEIQLTKADVSNRSFDNFFILQPNEFVFNRRTTRMGERLGLGYNDSDRAFIFTEDYVCFRIKDDVELLPCFLYIFFLRGEFDRYVRYDSWGSATEFFNWDSMCNVQIPLPSLATQQKLVDTYNGLKTLIEQNEALIKPLSDACQAYIVDCKQKYPEVKLGDYITQRREKNNNFNVPMRGVTRDGFIAPKQDGANTSLYNVFYRYDFVFNPARMELNSIYLNSEFDKAICSSLYEIFYVNKQNELLPEYLNLFIKRSEFARFCWYDAIGSARNYFRVANMQDIQVPLPPIDVQQAIVNIYNCAEEAKKIATEAREKMKRLCPALVQRAING